MNVGPSLLPRPIRRSGSAFSLVELMVSMAILTVLLVILMSLVDASTKLWRHSENRVDSYREARAAINTIATDLHAAVLTTNTNFFSLDRSDQLPPTAKLPPQANNVFFLSAQADDAQDHGDNLSRPKNTSDVCVVGYFLAFDKISSGSASKSLNLYRFFLRSDDAFKATKKDALLPESISTSPTASASAGAEVLARNITSFKVNAFTVDAAGKIVKFAQADETPVPDFADIELTALDNETVKRFPRDSEGEWTKTTSPTYLQNARTFRTRVHFNSESVKNPNASSPTPTPTPSPTPVL